MASWEPAFDMAWKMSKLMGEVPWLSKTEKLSTPHLFLAFQKGRECGQSVLHEGLALHRHTESLEKLFSAQLTTVIHDPTSFGSSHSLKKKNPHNPAWESNVSTIQAPHLVTDSYTHTQSPFLTWPAWSQEHSTLLAHPPSACHAIVFLDFPPF